MAKQTAKTSSSAKKSSSPHASTPPIKRLHRSKERILGGVCGGLAQYFNVDPVIVRLLWVLWALAFGTGILAYLIAWIIIPEQP